MKNNKHKKIKADQYFLGGITKLLTKNGLGNELNTAGNVTNVVTDLGSSLIPSSGNAKTDAITNGIAGGLEAVGSAFGPIGGIAGKAAGLLTKGIGALVGTADSVNTDTGEYIKGKGIKGRKSRNKAIAQWNRVNQGITDAAVTVDLQEQYANEYGQNDYSLAAFGGTLPNTLAYLDDGELIRTPDGQISSIPEEGKPTDSNLVDVPVGTQVLSDKLKVPGTNKTFAEMGQKLMKTGKKKGNDIYAQNSQMLNERNNQQKYNELMELQEQVKAKKGVKNKVGKYDIGTTGVSNISPTNQMYFDPFTQLINAGFEGIDKWLGLDEQNPYLQEARFGLPRISPRVSRWNTNRISLQNRNTPNFQNEVRPTGKGSEITKQKNIAKGEAFNPSSQPVNTTASRDATDIGRILDPKGDLTFRRASNSMTDEQLLNMYRGLGNLPVKYNPQSNMSLGDFADKYGKALAIASAVGAGSQLLSPDTITSDTIPIASAVGADLDSNALSNNRPQYYAERNLNLFNDGPAINSGLVRAGWSHGNPINYDFNYVSDIPYFDLSSYFQSQPQGRTGYQQRNVAVEPQTPIAIEEETKDPGFVERKKTSLAVSPKMDDIKIQMPKETPKKTNATYIPNFSSLIGPLANIYDSTPEQAPVRTYTPHFAPTEYNINPLLREIDLTNAISRYNVNRAGGAGTGANLAQAVQSQVARNRSIASAYAQKDNVERQRQAANTGIYNDWARYNAEAFHRGDVENAQNRAAARNLRRTGINQIGTALQSMNKDKRLTNRDKAVLEFMRPYLEYGTPSEALTGLYNRYYN